MLRLGEIFGCLLMLPSGLECEHANCDFFLISISNYKRAVNYLFDKKEKKNHCEEALGQLALIR